MTFPPSQYAGAKKAFTVNLGSFEFSWFMLVTALLLAASYVLLYKTRFGLRLMACGEHPQAADSVGINVYKMRWAGDADLRLPWRYRRYRVHHRRAFRMAL